MNNAQTEDENDSDTTLEEEEEDWSDEYSSDSSRELEHGRYICHRCKVTGSYDDNNGRAYCIPCQMAIAQHPQVMTKGGFPVDEKLKDIIEAFYDLDIETNNSCQENKEGICWIIFSSYYDFDTFVQRLANRDISLEDMSIDADTVTICFDEDEDYVETFMNFSWRFPLDQLEAYTKIVQSL